MATGQTSVQFIILAITFFLKELTPAIVYMKQEKWKVYQGIFLLCDCTIYKKERNKVEKTEPRRHNIGHRW